MKYLLIVAVYIGGVFLAPTPSAAQSGPCNCAPPIFTYQYCISLGCSRKVPIVDCGGIYHDSCFACYGAATERPCCPDAPAYSALYGGECLIVLAEAVTDRPVIYVRGFMRGCDGKLKRMVLGLPRAMDRRLDS